MKHKTFSIGEALSQGWKLFNKRPLFFIVLPLIPAVISSITAWGGGFITGGITQLAFQNEEHVIVSNSASIIAAAIQITSWMVSILVSIGIHAIYLETVKGKNKQFADLFAYKRVFIPYLLACIIVGLGSMMGFLLLIIPGIIWSLATQFYSFTVLTPGTGPWESIKESMRITKGVRIKLFLFGIVLALIHLLGILFFIVGVFVAIPVTGLSVAYVYQKLRSQTRQIK